jgi:hypothetical protein
MLINVNGNVFAELSVHIAKSIFLVQLSDSTLYLLLFSEEIRGPHELMEQAMLLNFLL